MTSKYEIENLLRPPVEYSSALVSFIFMGACFVAPYKLSMSPTVAMGVAGLFFISGSYRLIQGLKISTYHRSLKRLPRYILSLSKIKVSNHYLFMGKGFKWRETHTERIYAVRERKNEKYSRQSFIYSWVRNFEYQIEQGKLGFLAKLTTKDVFFNPFRPYPDVGGEPALHGVGVNEEKDITMRLSNRYGHHIVVGSTRVGKSRKAEVYITQDIHRNKDDLIVIFDPKGDPDLLKRIYVEAKAAGRLSELMIFHLGFPEISCAYNPLDSFTRLTELSTRVTGSLPETGDSKAFKDYAWQFTNSFSKGMFYCGDVPNYPKIKQAFKRPDLLLIKYAEKFLTEQGVDFTLEVEKLFKELKEKKQKKNNTRSPKAEAFISFVRDRGIYDNTLEDLIYINQLDPDYFAYFGRTDQLIRFEPITFFHSLFHR